MKKSLIKWCMFLLMAFSGYVVHAIITAPAISSIKDCPETAHHKIKLCNQNPNYVFLDEVSNTAIQAILVSEDNHFYEHQGFDIYEIITSVKKNLWHLQYARGGSTISQQVVKNIFLNGNKSFRRKIQEAYLTIKLEKTLNKRQILELYVNLIELGSNIFGIKQASEFYFHKKPADLTILESAYLAHLLPSPINYSKSFQRKKLTEFSRSKVLSICRNLWSLGYISAAQYLSAEKEVDDFPWHGTG